MNSIEKGELCGIAVKTLHSASGSLSNFPGLLSKIIATRAWESRTYKGKTIELDSLHDLITKSPLEGWGEDLEKVKALIADEPELLAAFRAEIVGRRGGNNNPDGIGGKSGKSKDIVKGNNITIDKSKPIRGTRADYTLTRLKKNHAELYQRVIDGELSCNQAAVKAGFREPTQTLPKDPYKLGQALKRKLTPDEWDCVTAGYIDA